MADKIRSAHSSAASFTELVHELSEVGVDSYTIDVASGIFIYRFNDGRREIHSSEFEPRKVTLYFDIEHLKKAINKLKEGDYDGVSFLNNMAKSGVRMVEVVLGDLERRMIYMGLGGHLIDSLKE